ncbi:MAG TPA: hypothetical protein VGK88_02270 [bacterium]|jgi:uncharacterized protein YybS (DUF2232 family)
MAHQMTMTKPTGPAAAALIAAGLGTFTIGLMTTLAEASAGFRSSLNFYNPSGPLSGKTGVAVVVWLISWFVLHSMWKTRNPEIGRILTWTLVFIGLGFLLTFPPIFEAFAAE